MRANKTIDLSIPCPNFLSLSKEKIGERFTHESSCGKRCTSPGARLIGARRPLLGQGEVKTGGGRRCCKNPNLPAALVPGFCSLKICENPQLLKKRRVRRRRENVERVRI